MYIWFIVQYLYRGTEVVSLRNRHQFKNEIKASKAIMEAEKSLQSKKNKLKEKRKDLEALEQRKSDEREKGDKQPSDID